MFQLIDGKIEIYLPLFCLFVVLGEVENLINTDQYYASRLYTCNDYIFILLYFICLLEWLFVSGVECRRVPFVCLSLLFILFSVLIILFT